MFRKKSTIILLAGILTLCSVAGIIYFINRNNGIDQTSLDYSSPQPGLTQMANQIYYLIQSAHQSLPHPLAAHLILICRRKTHQMVISTRKDLKKVRKRLQPRCVLPQSKMLRNWFQN